jgi:hypothetical protein
MLPRSRAGRCVCVVVGSVIGSGSSWSRRRSHRCPFLSGIVMVWVIGGSSAGPRPDPGWLGAMLPQAGGSTFSRARCAPAGVFVRLGRVPGGPQRLDGDSRRGLRRYFA